MRKLTFTLLLLALSTYGAAKGILYTTDAATGAIATMAIDGDPSGMNWVLSPDGKQYPWVTAKYGWGLGYLTVNGEVKEWGATPPRMMKGNLSYDMGSVVVLVRRDLRDGELQERYTFKNVGKAPLSITDCGIYTPWNDNYPSTAACLTNRCNAHIWAGDNAAYVCALRMGAPLHNQNGDDNSGIGMVLTEGSLDDYEVWQRGHDMGKSNFRGVMAMHVPDMKLKPGGSYTVGWSVFEHQGKADFFSMLRQHGSPVVACDKYVCQLGDTVNLYVNGSRAKTIVADSPGERRIDIGYGKGKTTHANILVVSNYDSLVSRRVRFILDHQQMNDTADARYGAFMVYDNETHSIYKNDRIPKRSDTDEGRERVGMGVLLAEYCLRHHDERLETSLIRYARFIRTKLQTSDYTTYSQAGVRNKVRGYNYAWISDFYFLMYDVTGDRQYALDGFHTLQALFRRFDHGFYCIDYPVITGIRALREAGLTAECDTLMADFGRVADNYIANGLNFPKFEVNFEQSIVAPAVQFLLEYYIISKDKRYLDSARLMMPVAENFCGLQPHYRMHEIAIRHWDGYWFGKRQTYGDVFPHYWSAINGMAYHYYSIATGDKSYGRRAEEVVRNNLANFFEDGSASCAFVFPKRVNGSAAHYADAFANDQDWALVFYLRLNK